MSFVDYEVLTNLMHSIYIACSENKMMPGIVKLCLQNIVLLLTLTSPTKQLSTAVGDIISLVS